MARINNSAKCTKADEHYLSHHGDAVAFRGDTQPHSEVIIMGAATEQLATAIPPIPWPFYRR